MSKLPRILSNNSEGFKSTLPNGQENSTNESFIKLTQSDLPYIKTLNTQQGPRINPIVYESKLSEFESKLQSMEEANSFLLTRLTTTERNFEIQLKEIQIRAAEEREQRFKSEKILSMFTDQSNLSSNDFKMKLDLLQEVVQKEDKFKGQQRERDIEMYKNLINQLTEKVSETVKMEVEARFKADIDNKLMTNNVIGKFETEIDVVRKEMSDLVNQTKLDIQHSSRECSERTHNVSKYIDMQISEAVLGKGSANDNLKNFVHKLTDQIKTNLISQNTQNELSNSRITHIETMVPLIKEDFYKFINSVEERLIDKMKDVKMFSELNITKSHKQLLGGIDELSQNTDKNVEYLTKQIMDTRNMVNKQMIILDQSNLTRFKAVCEDMQGLTDRIYLYEDMLKQYDEKNTEMKENLANDIASLRASYDVQLVNERIVHSIENHLLKEQVERCKVAILNMNNSVSADLSKMNQQSGSSFDGVVQRINYLQDMLSNVAEKNILMFDEFQRSLDKIEVQNLMSEMIFKAEDDNILSNIQNSKNMEHYLNLNVNNHQGLIDASRAAIKTNTNDIFNLRSQLTTLFSSFDSSGANMSQEMSRMQNCVKENEIRDGARAVLEEIINGVERKLDKNQNGGDLMNAINQLEEKINQQEQFIGMEFNKVWKEMMRANPKEPGGVIPPNPDNIEFRKTSGQVMNSLEQISNTLGQVLINAEFSNIYSILNKMGTSPLMDSQEGPKRMSDYSSDLVDSKIAAALEKVSNDNINMWIHAIQLTQKTNQTDEIRKIIATVPPVITPLSESLKRILDVDQRETMEPRAFVPKLSKEIRNAQISRNQKNENDIYDSYMNKQDDDNNSNSQVPQYQNNPNSKSNNQGNQDRRNDNMQYNQGNQDRGPQDMTYNQGNQDRRPDDIPYNQGNQDRRNDNMQYNQANQDNKPENNVNNQPNQDKKQDPKLNNQSNQDNAGNQNNKKQKEKGGQLKKNPNVSNKDTSKFK